MSDLPKAYWQDETGLEGAELSMESLENVSLNKRQKFWQFLARLFPNKTVPNFLQAFLSSKDAPTAILRWNSPEKCQYFRLRITRSGLKSDYFAEIYGNNSVKISALVPGTYRWNIYAIRDDGLRTRSITRSFTINERGQLSGLRNDITLTVLISEIIALKLDAVRFNSFRKREDASAVNFTSTTQKAREVSRFIKKPFTSVLHKIIQKLRNAICGQSKGSLRFVRLIEILIFSIRVLFAADKRKTKIWIAHDLYAIPVTWLLAKITRGKFMYDAVEMSLGRQRKTSPGWLSKKIILWSEGRSSNAAAVFSGCPYLKQEIDQRNTIKSTLVLNGQPPEYASSQIDLRRILNIHDRPEFKIVLYVGFIAAGRGLEELVDAVQFCNSKVVIVAIGPGPEGYAKKLQVFGDRIAKENCWISFQKAVKEEFVVDICKQADIGISPVSREFGNGKLVLNNKLFQYMAAQIPILASDVPGVGGFVQKEKIGIVFDERDPRDIARAIDEILRMNAADTELKENAVKASKKYGWPAQKQNFVETFNRAAGSDLKENCK
ncbi:MAG: glycosyltransferase family 4 protein [Sneathiellales bacterium]|nr:glycosyltransferase family 4 protein [Sneathiellales bacterium]